MQRFNGFFVNNQTPLARFVISRHSCSKLFVGGLCYDTNEPVLKQAFEQHGETIEVKVICNHKSGKSKGYGFVKFTSETAATKALKEMDGQFCLLCFLVIGWQKYSHQLCPQRMMLRVSTLIFPRVCKN
ncbi:glycine-rich RNA-binding protein 4, mitochondrial isoform X1 [Lycium ferocissimum]|uniref:glycine-rich RNA-binding protein 4, mitochondrial isoform X1 n=1 Tax=Lycium ferocissimum TaxID=112874 RepID=UPI0028160CFA|nr:glycine-rich RNA-binding protein 4, mitochondrial isoform X1 [Lycium ferocissimum]